MRPNGDIVPARSPPPAFAPASAHLKSALETSDRESVRDRRVGKHRQTLNERRTSVPDETSRAGDAPAARPAEKPTGARVSEDLIRLACLWQAGALSDDEFEVAKARILATYWSTQKPA